MSCRRISSENSITSDTLLFFIQIVVLVLTPINCVSVERRSYVSRAGRWSAFNSLNSLNWVSRTASWSALNWARVVYLSFLFLIFQSLSFKKNCLCSYSNTSWVFSSSRVICCWIDCEFKVRRGLTALASFADLTLVLPLPFRPARWLNEFYMSPTLISPNKSSSMLSVFILSNTSSASSSSSEKQLSSTLFSFRFRFLLLQIEKNLLLRLLRFWLFLQLRYCDYLCKINWGLDCCYLCKINWG